MRNLLTAPEFDVVVAGIIDALKSPVLREFHAKDEVLLLSIRSFLDMVKRGEISIDYLPMLVFSDAIQKKKSIIKNYTAAPPHRDVNLYFSECTAQKAPNLDIIIIVLYTCVLLRIRLFKKLLKARFFIKYTTFRTNIPLPGQLVKQYGNGLLNSLVAPDLFHISNVRLLNKVLREETGIDDSTDIGYLPVPMALAAKVFGDSGCCLTVDERKVGFRQILVSVILFRSAVTSQYLHH